MNSNVKEDLLAMEDRRILTSAVVVAADLAGIRDAARAGCGSLSKSG
jgi:hypothetical protein